jgi:hypothetical protein
MTTSWNLNILTNKAGDAMPKSCWWLGEEAQAQQLEEGEENSKDSIAKQIEQLFEEGQAGGNDISNEYIMVP